MVTFGYLLRRLRKAADLTQAELGRRVGCAADTIHKIETEARRPSQATAERLAEALALDDEDRDRFVRMARATLAPDRLDLPHRTALVLEGAPRPMRDNLPPQPTPFVGRGRELDLLAAMLDEPTTRLITICGLGGAGKTRLALAAAGQQRDGIASDASRFVDGVCFVALAGLRSGAQLVSAMMTSLGISPDRGPRSTRHQIVDSLRRKRLLLILDNFDTLIEEVELVGEIVTAAPEVTVLVTARERLQLRCEHVLMLEGLETPPRDAGPQATGYDAVRLFLQAADRVRPGYAPVEADIDCITAICRLVEGLPLAIEMAAAWVALLPPEAILAELQHGIDLLTSDLRDLPERQRSMRAVCATACRRLAPAEREIFIRLSVFHGGFTLDAARAVADAGPTLLSSLASHALLRYDPAGDRFSLHDLLRQYAAERLAADPANDRATRDRHATFFLRALARHALALRGARQLEALAALSDDAENLYVAWGWAVSSGLIPLIDLAADGLGHYYEWQGYLGEGKHAFRAAAEAAASWEPGPGRRRLQARLLAWHASFHAPNGPVEEALAYLGQSLDLVEHRLADDEDGRVEQAFALWRSAQLRAAYSDGDSSTLFRRSIDLYRALGRDWELSLVLDDLGELLVVDGQLDEAELVLREAQHLCEIAGDKRGLAQTLQLLSQVHLEADRLEEAERLARRSCALAQGLGSRPGLAAALGRLGTVLMHLSRFNEASDYLEQSLAQSAIVGAGPSLALAHSRLALCLAHLGEFAAGQDHARLAIAGDAQPSIMAEALALLARASCEEALGELADAAATLEPGIALCHTHRLPTMLGMMLAVHCRVAWRRSDHRQAGADVVEALRLALERHARMPLALLLPGCVMPLIAEGRYERAAEIYALDARAALWHDSQVLAPIRAAALAALAATLSPEGLAATLERGAALDLWATACELLADVEALGWGRPPAPG